MVYDAWVFDPFSRLFLMIQNCIVNGTVLYDC